MAENGTNGKVTDSAIATVRRRQWAARTSWYIYFAFVACAYLALFGPAANASVFASAERQLADRLSVLGDLLHVPDFLTAVFLAATFPLAAGAFVSGIFLLIAVRSTAWIDAAAVMFATCAVGSVAVKLALADSRGVTLASMTPFDIAYFKFAAILLALAAILAIYAQFERRCQASRSNAETANSKG